MLLIKPNCVYNKQGTSTTMATTTSFYMGHGVPPRALKWRFPVLRYSSHIVPHPLCPVLYCWLGQEGFGSFCASHSKIIQPLLPCFDYSEFEFLIEMWVSTLCKNCNFDVLYLQRHQKYFSKSMQELASKLEARFWMNRASIFFIFKCDVIREPPLEIFSPVPIDSTIHGKMFIYFFFRIKIVEFVEPLCWVLTKKIVLYELAF